MSATSAPFGLRPVFHNSGAVRIETYPIASGYAANIFKGDPVILATTGNITLGTAAADLAGVFDGVEYTDSTGKPTHSNYWPTGTVTSDAVSYIWADTHIVYEVQSSGSIATTAVGDQADVNNIGGSTSTGLSTTTLNSSLAGAGAQGQFRIIGFGKDPANAAGDAFTVVRVRLARSQFIYSNFEFNTKFLMRFCCDYL